ncbi:MAG: DUF5655 domain-containing protein [Dehalococcoidia bacterium]
MAAAGDIDAFFAGRATARELFEALRMIVDRLGEHEVRVTRSQVAFSRTRGFAWAWTPDRYLRGETAPLVLSVALDRRAVSTRWKEAIEPTPGRWMHHLELRTLEDLDDEVVGWLREAYALAG